MDKAGRTLFVLLVLLVLREALRSLLLLFLKPWRMLVRYLLTFSFLLFLASVAEAGDRRSRRAQAAWAWTMAQQQQQQIRQHPQTTPEPSLNQRQSTPAAAPVYYFTPSASCFGGR